MAHTTSTLTATDGLKLHTETWLPDGPTRAGVVIIHGLGEHIARYEHVAAAFNASGYAVFGIDHRGHGKSEGLRAYFETLDQPLADLKQFVEGVKASPALGQGQKLFIYGHSLGSLLTLNYLLRNPQDFDGALISGNTLALESTFPAVLLSVLQFINGVAPKLGLIPQLSSSMISHDPEVVRLYDADPLILHGNVNVRMSYLIMQGGRTVRGRMAELQLPMLIFCGSEDKICPPAGSPLLHQGVGAADKQLKIYSGMYHECHNEVDKAAVLRDLVAWLDGHTA